MDERRDDGRITSSLWVNANAKFNCANADIWVDNIANIGYNNFADMEV